MTCSIPVPAARRLGSNGVLVGLPSLPSCISSLAGSPLTLKLARPRAS